jgi:hypothetical protein
MSQQIDPLMYPPLRFGVVNPGIYRGGYPTLPNYRYLSRLQLKTIISLTPEPPVQDLITFGEMAGATCIHIPILRTAPLNEGLLANIVQALMVRKAFV